MSARVARGVTITVAVLAALVAGLIAAPSASAAPAVGVGPGTSIVVNREAACSLAVAGHDRRGRLVGLTAAHCGVVGSRVTLEGAGRLGQVGRIATRNQNLDYAIVLFDRAKVRAVRNVGQGSVHGVGAFPPAGQTVCKAGRTTGLTCGPVLENDPRFIDTFSYVCAAPGDSGGAVMAGGRLVGILNGGLIIPIPLTDLGISVDCIVPQIPIHSPMVSTRADRIFADLNGRNLIGSGFRMA